jgi:hypothetical protein
MADAIKRVRRACALGGGTGNMMLPEGFVESCTLSGGFGIDVEGCVKSIEVVDLRLLVKGGWVDILLVG